MCSYVWGGLTRHPYQDTGYMTTNSSWLRMLQKIKCILFSNVLNYAIDLKLNQFQVNN